MSSPAVNATTIRDYLKGHWKNYVEYNPAMALMKRKGNIRTGCEGTSVDWRIKAGRYAPTVTADYQDVGADGLYDRKNHYVEANIGWGEFAVGDSAGKGEFARQGPETAMVNVMRERVPSMAEDLMDEGLGDKFFNQSSTSSGDYVGLEALFATYTAGTDKSNKEASATLAAGGTYAGLSLALNGLSVDGVVSDAFTPTLINTGATWDGDGTTTTGWDPATAVEIVEYAINQLSFGNKKSMRPDCAIFSRSSFITLKQGLKDQQRYIVTGKADGSTGLGTNWEEVYVGGLPCTWDENVTTSGTNGYIINFDEVYLDQLRVPGPISGDNAPGGRSGIDTSMFDVEFGYNSSRRALELSATSRGQFRFNARHIGKIADFSS